MKLKKYLNLKKMKNYLHILSLILILSNNLFAQINVNNWTWIKGSNLRNQAGYYGFIGNPSAANSPGGRYGQVTSSTLTGKLFLMGGSGYDNLGNLGFLNDLWQFDPSTNNWVWLKGSLYKGQAGNYGVKGTAAPLNTPGGRAGSTSWFLNGKFYIMDGYGFDKVGNPGYLNDFWQFDPSTNNWKWLRGSDVVDKLGIYGIKGTAATLNEPGSRYGAISWNTNVLYMMGGHGYGSGMNTGSLNDLWKYDPTANNWTWLKGGNTTNQSGIYGVKGVSDPNNTPGSRYDSFSWELNGQLYLMGGTIFDAIGVKGYGNDLWKYNPVTNNWIWLKGSSFADPPDNFGTKGISNSNNTPGGRRGSATWVFNNKLYLMGGEQLYGSYNDLWEFDTETNNWTWLKGSNIPTQIGNYGTIGISSASNTPGSRLFPGSAYLYNFKLYLMGGNGTDNTLNQGHLNDVWEYVPCQQTVSVTNGNWDNPNTWSCGKVPTYNETVKIGHTISITGTGNCKNIIYTIGGKVNILGGGILQISTP